jgi:hypothetical protein
VGPGARERERPTGGAGRREKKGKTTVQLANSKTCTSRAPKITKILPKQDHTTKNIMQPLELKNLLWIVHKKSNNIAVFRVFQEFYGSG